MRKLKKTKNKKTILTKVTPRNNVGHFSNVHDKNYVDSWVQSLLQKRSEGNKLWTVRHVEQLSGIPKSTLDGHIQAAKATARGKTN